MKVLETPKHAKKDSRDALIEYRRACSKDVGRGRLARMWQCCFPRASLPAPQSMLQRRPRRPFPPAIRTRLPYSPSSPSVRAIRPRHWRLAASTLAVFVHRPRPPSAPAVRAHRSHSLSTLNVHAHRPRSPSALVFRARLPRHPSAPSVRAHWRAVFSDEGRVRKHIFAGREYVSVLGWARKLRRNRGATFPWRYNARMYAADWRTLVTAG